MDAEHQYFYEDEVYRINKKGIIEFGMVIENSELVSSDENSDNEEGFRMKKGHIRVAWHPTGVEEVIPEKKVGLADRSLMPGDVVRRLIKGKDTQRGYCRNVQVRSCVQVVGTKQVITNVPSKDLVQVETFCSDVAVCLDSWVGTVKTVNSKIHLAFADGSKCVISDMEAGEFVEVDERRTIDGELTHRNDFHPGQVLQGPMGALEEAVWVVQSKEMKALKGKPSRIIKVVVESVETESVSVHWQCRAFSHDATSSVQTQQPPFLIHGPDLKKLKLLNIFEPCTLQIGDRLYYTVKDSDRQLTKDQWRVEMKQAYAKLPHSATTHSRKRKGGRVESVTTPASPSPEPLVNEASLLPQLDPVVVPPSVPVEDWETDTDTGSVSSGCSSNSSAGGGSGRSGKKKKSLPGLMTKVLKLKKLRRSRHKPPSVAVKPNTRAVVEALVTSSTADVVWQDGNVEDNIPSTQLYPIHHLDDQEFFPGDFVTENKDEGCLRVYGVVQSVDHVGRIAVVNWFHTYTSNNERQPTALDSSQVSVYDLKDHPDFQYRPGTVAIRVANFEGEDASCTAGQVLDNYPEGRVYVWWVDGHESMCWPQDLFKVGDYDSDEGELWDDGSSEGSWETESEGSFASPEDELATAEAIKPKLAANIEKARKAMSRLEELFTLNPALQTVDIMKKLLEVYKDCRYLDKLMGTSFFHESHFQGLLERVREKGRGSVGHKVVEPVSRSVQPAAPEQQQQQQQQEREKERVLVTLDLESAAGEEATKVLEFNQLNNAKSKEECKATDNLNVALEQRQAAGNSEDEHSLSTSTEKSPGSINGHLVQSSSADDSGVFDHSGYSADVSASHENCDCLAKPAVLRPDEKKGTFIFGVMGSRSMYNSEKRVKAKYQSQTSVPAHTDPVDESNTTQVCAKLCALIKSQLVKAHAEVSRRFNGDVSPAALQEAAVDEEEPAEQEVQEERNKTEEEGSCLGEGFSIMANAPSSHKYKLSMCPTVEPGALFKTVRKELTLLRTSLPPGIWVKGFEDRMDLYSVMIRGPEKTPYEDGLFLFDVQLPSDYPHTPPACHYLSYCSDRLNPNLYEDGKVCVSLLGTWSGKGTEVWTLNSNMLQVIISIQGLILVSEPYFNEAGYEKQKGSQQGRENSRMYNEMAVLKLLQAMTKLIVHPPEVFQEEIKHHFAQHSDKLVKRLEKWLDISEQYNAKLNLDSLNAANQTNEVEPVNEENPEECRALQWQKSLINIESAADQPEFPLLPASRGFCLSLRKTLTAFRSILESLVTS